MRIVTSNCCFHPHSTPILGILTRRKARKANKKENKNGSQPKENKKRKWKVGDYCRAIYSTDKSYYEAKIISLNGDFCTVEFLGYGDTEDVDLLELKESEGKKARRKQIKTSMADSFDYNSSIDESEAVGETTDGTVASYSAYRKKKHHVNQPANNTTFDTTTYEATIHQQYPAAAAPPPAAYYAPPMPTSMPFMAPPATMPQYPVPPAPPMPQCPSLANNPSFSSMLSAWYMAGYYTGLHSVQKENRGCQRCCSHSIHAAHN
ncbi:hypothetical protein AVEN_182010-1 [Araneus ventricosus]|uniref:Tudor domain-containing protein n=1 Tax=Araneus ventricosus TaxID=182803 RepID=A0A4Y2TF44_ARAVE|nr:hypothetical protein AVEN_182010-1 [Araneus ventricosus]